MPKGCHFSNVYKINRLLKLIKTIRLLQSKILLYGSHRAITHLFYCLTYTLHSAVFNVRNIFVNIVCLKTL